MSATLGILAGGRGTRMGMPKTDVLLGSRTLVDHALATLGPSFDQVVVSGPAGIPDSEEGLGPLSGMAAVLRASIHPRIVIVACDLPFVTSRLALFVLSKLDAQDAAVPVVDGRPQPLCAAYSSRVLPEIDTALTQRRLRVQDLLARLEVRFVSTAELEESGFSAHHFRNLNAPADVVAAERELATWGWNS